MHRRLAAANPAAPATVSPVAPALRRGAVALREAAANQEVALSQAARVKLAGQQQQEAVNPAVLAKLAQAALLQKRAETVEHVVAPTLAQPVADGGVALAAVHQRRVAAHHRRVAGAVHQPPAPHLKRQ